jgi:acyl-CoA dehydrogenase
VSPPGSNEPDSPRPEAADERDGVPPDPQAVLRDASPGDAEPEDVLVGPAAPAAVDAARPPAGDAYASLRTRVRAWIASELAPHVDEWEAAGATPRAAYEAAGSVGLFGYKVDTHVGGQGVDYLADLVVTEELAACGSAGVAAALGAHKDLGSYYVWRFGTDAQRRAHLPEAMAGRQIAALAVTEPGAGSDVAGLRAMATPRPGGDWRLSGTKTFITGGAVADLFVVAALTDPDAGGHHGTSLLLVRADDPGVDRRRIPTLGWRPGHTAEIRFTDVDLPAERILGGPARLGEGFACLMRNFEWERIVMAAAAVRGAEQTLALAAAAVAAATS